MNERHKWRLEGVKRKYYGQTSRPTVGPSQPLIASYTARCTAPSISQIQIHQIVLGVLIGNKTDLKQRRNVSEEEAKKLAADLDLEYFEVTAKEYSNVEAPFYFLCNAFHKLFMEKVVTFHQDQ